MDHRLEFEKRRRRKDPKAADPRPSNYFDEMEKRKPYMGTDQERKSAMDRFSETYEAFHRKSTESTRRGHHEAITECVRVGISPVEMTKTMKAIHLKVARQNLVAAVTSFQKDPTDDQALDALRSTKAAYSALGGSQEEIKGIVKGAVK